MASMIAYLLKVSFCMQISIVLSSNFESPDAWRCCSQGDAVIMQTEWNALIDHLSSEQKVTLVTEIWRRLADVSPIGAIYLEAFYVGPLHLYPPEEQDIQRKRGYINFLAQQGVIINLLTHPEALMEHTMHFQRQLKVQKKPASVKSSPEAGWEQLTQLFEDIFLKTMGSVASQFSPIAWEGCFRTMRMLVEEATPERQAYYGKCTVLPSTGVPGQNITGSIVFEQKVGEEKTTVKIDLDGFDPEDADTIHGFHIHEVGATGDQCKEAGGHYNPLRQVHGASDQEQRHIGDLGNIEEDGEGNVRSMKRDDRALLLGDYSIFGKSVVIHQTADDLGLGGYPDSKTTGHAGARLACCVIEFTPQMMTSVAECSELAKAGHCGYYSCLDRKLTCYNGFFNSFGHQFCLKTEHEINGLSRKEITWLKTTNTCITRSMAAQITDDSTCSARGLSVTALMNCLNGRSICDMMHRHKRMLHNIFTRTRFLTLVQAASHCPRHIVGGFIHYTMRRIQ